MFQSDLDHDLAHEEGGALGRILRSIAAGGRAENHSVDMNLAQKDAQDLYDVSLLFSLLLFHRPAFCHLIVLFYRAILYCRLAKANSARTSQSSFAFCVREALAI